MRWLLGLLVLASCGKQLNAEYCAQKENAMDPDCIAAGFTRTDAPAPCSNDMMCPGQVCDVTKGSCEACTPQDFALCPSNTPKCGPDDQCHQCLIDGDCAGGGMCLPDFTCVSSDSFLYTTPNGDGTCAKISPCNLTTAIGKLDITHRAIAVGTGDYQEGPLTIDQPAVLIGQGANGDPTLTTITNASGQNGAVITVRTAMVALDYVSVYGSPDDDGVTCSSGGVTFHHSNSHDNGGYGLSASGGCSLGIDRAYIYKNQEAALLANGATIQVFNNFMYDNGNGNMNAGAVRLINGTMGMLQYNSISFNHFKASNTDGGLTCGGANADVEFNIIAGNDGKQAYTNNGCTMMFNYVGQSAANIKYASAVPPYDLHLTQQTPEQQDDATTPIRDNSNTTCAMNNINLDIDGNGRPINTFCDLGGDEFAGPPGLGQ
jgi:hypothetical protein